MANVLQNLGGVWQRISLVQRIVLLAIVLACAGASALLLGWASKPDMSLLYAGLSIEEAARIVDKVTESGAPYELREEGTAVYVPAAKVHSLRLTLASQGLPKGDQGGYKILDDDKLGMSPFNQRVNYLRAKEGELAKTIQFLDGVASARVHVVRPEEVLFAGREKEASATAVLKLKPGRKLTPGNVAAIVHILAGSVEGLNPQKVVVVDAQGNLLSNTGDDAMAAGAGTFLDYKSRVEEYYARKAEEMLSAALGPNRASVRVDAVIDTTSIDSTTETYDPEKKVVQKEETKNSSSAAPTAQPAAGTTKDETMSNEYLVSKTVEKKLEVPGKVKSLTVAAFVDLSAPAAPAATAGQAQPATPAPKMTIKDAEDIIRNAIGLKPADTLKVVETPFYRPPVSDDLQVQEEKQSKQDFYLEIARRSSLGVLVVGALVALKIFRGPRKKGAAGMTPALEGSMGQAALPGGEMDMNPEMLRSRITRALQENPEDVKRLFLSWVESEKGGA